ncbi:MAG: hypothetical protein CVV32_05000 [Methanomicrobiales archaeon HGW-Methanomicrobiales-3]|nr:MAG: hypothetical protein CVV32_05000 [Methanomicrobiales archaeon HGW-Methanomicrobiales-3]
MIAIGVIKIAIRLKKENRGSILRSKSLIDSHRKNAIRFYVPSVLAVKKTGFQSQIDFTIKIADRFYNQNR